MKKKVQDILWWAFLILSTLVLIWTGGQISDYLREADNSKSLNRQLFEQAVSEKNTEHTDAWSEDIRDSEKYNAEHLSSEESHDSMSDDSAFAESGIPPNSDIVSSAIAENTWLSVDFDILRHENEDIVAWLYCPGTVINYPVVQAEDNEHYLRRLVNGESNTAGTLFLDCRNWSDFSDQNSVIHGHHMKNNSMFGTLDEYSKQSYYEKHPVWQLSTPEKDYYVELIAGYVTNESSGVYKFGLNRDEKVALLKESIRISDFKANVEWESDDLLVTFSTCSYEYDEARYVVIGILREM